jgi:hypothetical protein
MKKAEFLLSFMDALQAFVEKLNTYIEQGLHYLEVAKEWVQKLLTYIEEGIDKLVDAIGGRSPKIDLLKFQEEDLFV